MASIKKKVSLVEDHGPLPTTLDGHPFFGIDLGEEQKVFAEAILNPEYRWISAEAVAGSGKTTIAVGAACLLCYHKVCDEVLYVRVPTTETEQRVGFLPGTLGEKTRFYHAPLYNTLLTLGENPYPCINDDSMANQKNGTGFITPLTDVYMRGEDYERKAVIIDEAQNATVDQLKTIISRCHDDCKVIVIGSLLQVDLADKSCSGFQTCIDHFASQPWAKVCHLTHNYRGEMSAWADKM